MADPVAEVKIPIETVALDTSSTEPIGVLSLAKYLAGSRAAILKLAASRQALWIGLFFVLSAGFAREYDGADLWREPWHLALPLVASLVTSLVLYTLVYMAARSRGVSELGYLSGYRTLLTFYWWTAPLAWLYAIPYERFLSPGDATAANYWTLAIVSVWRVLLITRALSVWLSANFVAMFFIVMLFADSVALLLAFASPQPIFDVMGGIRHSRPDAVTLDVMLSVMFYGGVSWLIWLIGACVVIAAQKPAWSLSPNAGAPPTRVSKPLWAFAVLLIAVGFALLPLGQPQQQRRSQAEQLLNAGQLNEAVQFVSQFSPDDFPPIWDPPPRVGYGERTPAPAAVLLASENAAAPEWFRALYVDKLMQNPQYALRDVAPMGNEKDSSAFEQLLTAYEKYIPLHALDRHQRRELSRLADDDRIDAASRDRLRAYVKSADDEQPANESE